MHSPLPGAKISRHEHLSAIADQTGEEPEDLNGPEVPEMLSYVFEWFMELHSARHDGPIRYSEIKAWAEMTKTTISPFEVSLIKQIDIEFLKNQSDGRRFSKTDDRG